MITRFLIKIIEGVLWLIDSDHRQTEAISAQNHKKFTHVLDVDFMSDFGRATKVFRTVPYRVWELKTETKTLLAADRHRVIREDNSPVWVEDLVAGDRIKTDMGPEVVISCRDLGVRAHMYSLEVNTDDPQDPNNHLYYGNGILSHNTTTAGSYLLWRAMFVENSKILIVANKLLGAQEVMRRVKFSYEECPDFIKAGVKKWNEFTVEFDNGSIIEAVATTPDAARGKSLTLLYLDEFAFVPFGMAKDFWTAVQPTLSTGGDCIITSTPRTDEDQFAQLWKGAQITGDEYGNDTGKKIGKNGFHPISVPWWEHPERDEEWAAPYRSSLGPARFAQEFECLSSENTVTIDDGSSNRDVSIGDLFALLKLGNQSLNTSAAHAPIDLRNMAD